MNNEHLEKVIENCYKDCVIKGIQNNESSNNDMIYFDDFEFRSLELMWEDLNGENMNE